METVQDTKPKNDAQVIAFLLVAAGIAFVTFSNSIDPFVRNAVIGVLAFSYGVGIVGKDRKIGFGGAFFLSLILSPILGIIFALTSPVVRGQAYEEKMRAAANTNTSVAEQLSQLNDLRKEGVLTEEEFAAQKHKLLGQ